jgi:hypothetical protein
VTAPDDDAAFLAEICDLVVIQPGDCLPSDERARRIRVATAGRERLARGELLMGVVGPHGFSRDICRIETPRFPRLVSPLDYLDKPKREALGDLVRDGGYSLTVEETASTRSRWDPHDDTVLHPCKDPDLAAFHFVNAYRACIDCLFGKKPPQTWTPLSPVYRNGRGNGNCKRFTTFLGNFCQNGFIYPHGWIFYRLNVLWEYGKLRDRVKDGSLWEYLRKYSTFLHVLDGHDCSSDPKKYQPYNRDWKHRFGVAESCWTENGEELESLRRATVNRLAREGDFICRNGALAALQADGYQVRKRALIKKSELEYAHGRNQLYRDTRNGKWSWQWPVNGGDVRKVVNQLKKESK